MVTTINKSRIQVFLKKTIDYKVQVNPPYISEKMNFICKFDMFPAVFLLDDLPKVYRENSISTCPVIVYFINCNKLVVEMT